MGQTASTTTNDNTPSSGFPHTLESRGEGGTDSNNSAIVSGASSSDAQPTEISVPCDSEKETEATQQVQQVPCSMTSEDNKKQEKITSTAYDFSQEVDNLTEEKYYDPSVPGDSSRENAQAMDTGQEEECSLGQVPEVELEEAASSKVQQVPSSITFQGDRKKEEAVSPGYDLGLSQKVASLSEEKRDKPAPDNSSGGQAEVTDSDSQNEYRSGRVSVRERVRELEEAASCSMPPVRPSSAVFCSTPSDSIPARKTSLSRHSLSPELSRSSEQKLSDKRRKEGPGDKKQQTEGQDLQPEWVKTSEKEEDLEIQGYTGFDRLPSEESFVILDSSPQSLQSISDARRSQSVEDLDSPKVPGVFRPIPQRPRSEIPQQDIQSFCSFRGLSSPQFQQEPHQQPQQLRQLYHQQNIRMTSRQQRPSSGMQQSFWEARYMRAAPSPSPNWQTAASYQHPIQHASYNPRHTPAPAQHPQYFRQSLFHQQGRPQNLSRMSESFTQRANTQSTSPSLASAQFTRPDSSYKTSPTAYKQKASVARSSGGHVTPQRPTGHARQATAPSIQHKARNEAERAVNRPHTVSSPTVKADPDKAVDTCRKVRVKGLTTRVSEHLLQLYFEKHGDTDSVEVHMVPDRGEAIVEFDSPAVVQAVLAQSHTIGGKPVTVVPEATPSPDDAPSAIPKTSTTPAAGIPYRPAISAQACTVEVQGLAPGTTKDTVLYYFENKRRSGGGVLEDLQYEEGSSVALITFQEREAMTRVLGQQHQIDGRILRVSRASPHQASTSVSPTYTAGESASAELTAVSVRGLPLTKSMDALALYFENERRSGGGDVREVQLDEQSGLFFVIFQRHEDAARVAARSHTIDNQKLEVRLEKPPQPYADRIQLRNLPQLRTMDELRDFVEAKTQLLVNTILFGEAGDMAVVTFESPVDIGAVRAAMTKKPFRGHEVTVDPIFQSRTVLVKNLPQHPPVTKDMLFNYFENTRRNKGGEVSSVQIDEDGQYALITFADPEVALRVSAVQHYKLEGCPLAVSLYLKSLGLSGGSSEPTASLPPRHPLSDSQFQKLTHLQNLPGRMHDLQDSLTDRHAHLELGAGSGSVVCTLTQEVANVRQLARTWADDINGILENHLRHIFVQQLEVTAEEFAQAERRAKQKISGDDDVNLSYDSNKELLTMVIKGENKKPITEEIVTVIQTAKTEVTRKKQERTDKIPVGKGKLHLLKKHKTVRDATEKYPKLEIILNEDNECIELKGHIDEIQDVKLKFLEAVTAVVSRYHAWDSDLHKQLLALPTARMTVESLCMKQGPEEVTEFTQDGFYVHSFDVERAEVVQLTAIQAVQRRIVRFDEASRNAIRLQEWSDLKYSIIRENDELVVMEETAEALILLGIGPSVQSDYRRLVDFLEKSGVKQQALELPRAMHKLFKPYFLEKVNDMQFKQDDFVFDPDNDQIIISGNKLCLETAEGIVHAFKQDLTMKQVTFTQPSMKEFLTTAEWVRKKEDIVLDTKCLVLDPEELPAIYRKEIGMAKKGDAFFLSAERSSDGGAEASDGLSFEQMQSAFMSTLPQAGVRQSRRRIRVPNVAAAPSGPHMPARPRIFLSTMSDITKEEHHVLVNSTNPALRLRDGQVSKDLLRVGGKEIQDECNTKYPQGIKMGDVAVTEGGKLMCKRIFHCTLPQETNEQKIQKVVGDAVMKCLKQADKLKLGSIGFPALGTGTLAYPAALVANTLYEATLDYGRRHPDTNISDVIFILHKKDTVLTQVFRETDEKYKQMLSECRESHLQNPGEDLDLPSENQPLTGVQHYPFFESTKGRVEKILVGLSQDVVARAEKELTECYDNSVVTVTENDLQLDQWDELHKGNLINACKAVNVDVTLCFDLGRLTFRGFREKVARIPKHDIFKEAEAAVKEQHQARLILQQVQWSSIEVSTTGIILSAYSMLNNYRIEMDYTEGKERTVVAEFVDGIRLAYTIDFTKMEEIPEDPKEADKPRLTVIRKNKIRGVEVQQPKNWSDMGGKAVDVVPLQPSSPEYQGIAEIFKQSLEIPARIEKIERIQNLTLYKQYEALKQQMESCMPQNKLCEWAKLWHGTNSEAVDGIIFHGFNRSFSDLTRSAYGQGSYFAASAAYASRNEYAAADLTNQRNMFMCRVLVGEYTLGDRGMRIPPEMTPGGQRYHSTVNDVEKPEIFVIYNDVQAYPEYRIVFKDN